MSIEWKDKVLRGCLEVIAMLYVVLLLTRMRTPADINLAALFAVPMACWPLIAPPVRSVQWAIDLACMALIAVQIWISLAGDTLWHQCLANTVLLLGLRGLALQVATRDMGFAIRVTGTTLCTCIASVVLLWFTVQSLEAVVLRQSLYPGIEEQLEAPSGVDAERSQFFQGGLAWTVPNMGYQLAVAIPLAAALALSSMRATLVMSLPALILGWGVVLLGQRSVVGASFIGVLVANKLVRPSWQVCSLIVAGIIVGGSALVLVDFDVRSEVLESRSYHLLARFEDATVVSDPRFDVQMSAIAEILVRPEGFGSFEAFNDRAPSVGGVVLAPHNHVLTYTWVYGWLVGGTIAVVIGLCVVRMQCFFRSVSQHPLQLLRAGWAGALCGALLNALFHNAGLGSLDGPSLLSAVMVLAVGDRAIVGTNAMR